MAKLKNPLLDQNYKYLTFQISCHTLPWDIETVWNPKFHVHPPYVQLFYQNPCTKICIFHRQIFWDKLCNVQNCHGNTIHNEKSQLRYIPHRNKFQNFYHGFFDEPNILIFRKMPLSNGNIEIALNFGHVFGLNDCTILPPSKIFHHSVYICKKIFNKRKIITYLVFHQCHIHIWSQIIC